MVFVLESNREKQSKTLRKSNNKEQERATTIDKAMKERI
jgi:hypothetical protein